MVRITAGNVNRNRRKKYFKASKGYRVNGNLYSFAKEQYKQSLNFAYVGRRLKKRDFRKIWIRRISAAIKILGHKYSTFMGELKRSEVYLNRKILAEILTNDAGVAAVLNKH